MARFRENYQLIAALTFLIGVVLITIGESAARLDWTRAFGAGAITAGAIGIGAYIGLTQPARWVAARTRLSTAKQPIGIAILVLTFLPAVLALLAGLAGSLDDPDGTGWVVLTGILVLALMLAATVAGFLVGLQAIRGAAHAGAAVAGEEEAG